jgi:hypothetical protein
MNSDCVRVCAVWCALRCGVRIGRAQSDAACFRASALTLVAPRFSITGILLPAAVCQYLCVFAVIQRSSEEKRKRKRKNEEKCAEMRLRRRAVSAVYLAGPTRALSAHW